jgi:transposase
MMRQGPLSDEQREAAVELFESGYGRRAVANRLGVRLHVVQALQNRWRIWGRGVLVSNSTQRVYPFELKREIVLRYLAGDEKVALANEYALSSPDLIKHWVRIYRAKGEVGLRPKRTGHPPQAPAAPESEEHELDQLRRENERLRAEVAYLGKLKALMSREQP